MKKKNWKGYNDWPFHRFIYLFKAFPLWGERNWCVSFRGTHHFLSSHRTIDLLKFPCFSFEKEAFCFFTCFEKWIEVKVNAKTQMKFLVMFSELRKEILLITHSSIALMSLIILENYRLWSGKCLKLHNSNWLIVVADLHLRVC